MFADRKGHLQVPYKHRENGSALRAWINRQREKWRDGKLLEEHRELLEKVPGWKWGEEGVAQVPMEEEPRHGGHEWNFLHTDDGYRVMIVSAVLFGKGPLAYEEAVTLAIQGAFEGEFEPKRHLREGGRSRWLVERAIRHALKKRKLEQPALGTIKSVERDASWYHEEEWETCVRRCALPESIPREDAVERVIACAVDL